MAASSAGMLWLMLAAFFIIDVTDGADTPDKFKCPEGWMLGLESCYKWGTSQMTFSRAQDQCRQSGATVRLITNKEENQLFSVSDTGGTYWLGIVKSFNQKWGYQTNGTTTYLTYTKFTQNIHNYNYGMSCAVWQSQTQMWLEEACTNRHLFICQKPPDCVPGRFGENCARQCHCKGHICDATSGLCKYGCQIGWTGESCDTEKKKAEAKFYCFKIQARNVMMFRVDQRGTVYRDVSAIDEYGDTVDTCSRTVYDHFETGGTGTLKVTQTFNNSFTPNCGGNEVSNEVHSWRFRFREYPGTSSAYDIMFEVKCDFTNANSLEISTAYNTDKPANKSILLTESTVSVSLDIIDPVDNLSIAAAKLGQQVRLQMKLNNVDESGVNAISPYNCSIGTLDHRHNTIFIDEHGCSPRDAQIVFRNTDVTTWRSEMFETFAFPGYDKLFFRCQYQVCFTEDQHYCRDMCSHSRTSNHRQPHKRSVIFNHMDEEKPAKLTTLEIV
ncbi:uncharacterized protein LOC124136207 isoform X1 [Haliotis rufescens]|uniref:uncharacterized protein LOC124136207 isoform X1 n=1 Tax=Haliotis rufescens TaxID=6454 RepID=UPI00201EB29A|nr:uncharacterized protein LOC124136207 isoform X1 [Haliotis rufescens]